MCRLCQEKRRQSGCDGCCMRCAREVGIEVKHDSRRCLRCPNFRQAGGGGFCIRCAQEVGYLPRSKKMPRRSDHRVSRYHEATVVATPREIPERPPRFATIGRQEFEVVFDGTRPDS